MHAPTLAEQIADIPGDDGWWKSDSEDSFNKLADQLIELGVSEDTVVEFLETAYWAAASCFGA